MSIEFYNNHDKSLIPSLTEGTSHVLETEYTVEEADVTTGYVLNVATAQGTSTDPDMPEVPVTPGERLDHTE